MLLGRASSRCYAKSAEADYKGQHFHAAATTSRHVLIAAVRSTRCRPNCVCASPAVPITDVRSGEHESHPPAHESSFPQRRRSSLRPRGERSDEVMTSTGATVTVAAAVQRAHCVPYMLVNSLMPTGLRSSLPERSEASVRTGIHSTPSCPQAGPPRRRPGVSKGRTI